MRVIRLRGHWMYKANIPVSTLACYFNLDICFWIYFCVSINIFWLYRKVSGSLISETLIRKELMHELAFSKRDKMVGADNTFG